MSLVSKRLAEGLGRAPKSGYKASLYTGLVSKLLSMTEEAMRAVELSKCIGMAKGSCRSLEGGGVLCNPQCSGVYMVESDGSATIVKVGSGSIAIRVGDTLVEVKTGEGGIIMEPGRLRVLLPAMEGWKEIEVDMGDYDVIAKMHFVKQAIRRVGQRLTFVNQNLARCARSSAITC